MKSIEKYFPAPIPPENQTETVSVAVAVYNSEKYLERSLDSLLSQTYRNLEIILVDDGSTDGCPAICDRYAALDSRVRVIHKPNGGLFSARNAGIDAASGEYLAFMDGDDWPDPEMYGRMVSAMRQFDAQLCVCRYRKVFRDRVVDLSTDRALVMEGQEILEEYLKEDDACLIQNAAWNKLYRRSLLGGLRFPSRWYEDMLYTVQLLARPSRSVYLDRACFNYVCDRESSIMNMGLNERVFSDLIPNLYDRSAFLRRIGREDLALLQDYALYKRLLLFYRQVCRSHDGKKKEHKDFLEEKLREGAGQYPAVYGIPYAKKTEYQKMKLFLASPPLFRAIMRIDDFILPLKVRAAAARKKPAGEEKTRRSETAVEEKG